MKDLKFNKSLKEKIIEVLIDLMNDEGDAHSENLKEEHLKNAQALSRAINLVKNKATENEE